MDSAKDQDAFVKKVGKEIAASTVHATPDAHFMDNARMEPVFAKRVSMENIVHFRLAILLVRNKKVYVVAMDHVNLDWLMIWWVIIKELKTVLKIANTPKD